MSRPPPPLVPIECDLRDFQFMPLDVVRLRDSDLAATPDGEVFRAAVLAWCASWHQLPAASLPDDDAVLARLLGYGRDVQGWLKLREHGVLRHFVKCSDGRLYHPVVAEKATDAWRAKQAQRDRTEKARLTRLSQRLSQTSDRDVTDDTVTNVTQSKGQGQGQGESQSSLRSESDAQKLSKKPSRPKPGASEPEGFAEFYDEFPKKEGRADARKAYAAALKNGAVPRDLIDGARRYAISRRGEDEKFTKTPAPWLRAEKWLDGQSIARPNGTLPLAPANGHERPLCAQEPGESREHFLVRRFKTTGVWLENTPRPDSVDTSMPKLVRHEFGYTQREDFDAKIAAGRAQETRSAA